MEFEVPKRHISRPTLSTGMIQQVLWWERQRRCYSRKKQGPIAEKCFCNKFLMKFYQGGEDEDKRRQEKGQTWIYFFTKLSFLDIYFLNQHIHFLVHDHSTYSTFSLHLVRGPKTLSIEFFEKIRPWMLDPKSDHEKYHLPCSDFMVHDVKRASHPSDRVGYTKFGHNCVPLEGFFFCRSVHNLETRNFLNALGH